ncbi:ankyrin [Penicillium soppii]|uniref:ankyrin n=1 Tax=Penicillium soppii TaxID=69789 RepID=UPI002548B423|nr:ankyrin [Penicillium soppii]KAJ5882526.1 ankyrin [Penicillium soppii]
MALDTIITSTTEDIDKDETSFLQLVVSAFRAQKNISSVSVEFMKDLILRTATGLFYKKEIDVLGKRKSPLDVYREAILTVGEYTDVANHSEDERFEDEFERRMITKNPYDNISEETELLREVKDISDELNMLKNLAEDQEDVWKQVWKDEHKPDSGFTHEIPSDIKGEIEEMIKEADFVQQAINALLDLKQKQANIVEAKYTRKQSDDTAVQGDTIMVFTVVTILFVSLVCLVNI